MPGRRSACRNTGVGAGQRPRRGSTGGAATPSRGARRPRRRPGGSCARPTASALRARAGRGPCPPLTDRIAASVSAWERRGMALTHQPSLLDLADTAQLARPLTDATRTELAGGAWVDHLPALVGRAPTRCSHPAPAPCHGAPIAGRCQTGSWTCLGCSPRTRSPDSCPTRCCGRRTARCPRTTRPSSAGALRRHRAAACTATGATAWHGTGRHPRSRRDNRQTIVAIVSFGSAPRAAAARPAPADAACGPRARHGDLLVMGGRPATAHVGARRPEERRRRGGHGSAWSPGPRASREPRRALCR